MKRVFITGSAGFIGGYVSELFLKNNWHTTALVHRNKPDKLKKYETSGSLELVSGSASDIKDLRSAITKGGRKLDAIVHCAGRASDVGRRREFRLTNLDSVRHLVSLTKEMDIPKFVFISTTDVYGLHDFNGETEDELELKPFPRNPYPEFKILAEKHIRAELPENRFSIIRPAQVWGQGDKTLTPRIVDFLRKNHLFVHFGEWKGRNRWPLAHVRNVAMTTYLATIMPEAEGKNINVTDNEHTSIEEFYTILSEIYFPGTKFKRITLPFFTGFMFGTAVSAISNLFNLQRPFTDPSLYAVYSVSRNLNFSNRRMRDLFEKAGQKLFTMEEGIEELKDEINDKL